MGLFKSSIVTLWDPKSQEHLALTKLGHSLRAVRNGKKELSAVIQTFMTALYTILA